MTARSEYDAAYFTLLRAHEERTTLQRYAEFLEAEQRRLDDFTTATREGIDELPRQVRRPVDATTRPLLEAVGRRRSVVLDERRRMDDRLANADRFVTECESEVDRLRP